MGGDEAVLEPSFSATNVLKTLSGLEMEQSGKFLILMGVCILGKSFARTEDSILYKVEVLKSGSPLRLILKTFFC